MAFFSISSPQLAIGPSFGDRPNNGIKWSHSISNSFSISAACFTATPDTFLSPRIPITSAGVTRFIFPLFFNSCTLSTESKCPRNSLRL